MLAFSDLSLNPIYDGCNNLLEPLTMLSIISGL
jgi:hypothetical protein